MEGVEWTTVKYTQQGYIEKQTPLNINLNINNEKQGYKIGTVGGY
jgi:hypothetical protein